METGREGGVVGAGKTVRCRRRAGSVVVYCPVKVLLPWAVDTCPNEVTEKEKWDTESGVLKKMSK